MNLAPRLRILRHPAVVTLVVVLAIAGVFAANASRRVAHMPGSLCSTENRAELLARNEALGLRAGKSIVAGGMVVASNPVRTQDIGATFKVRNFQFDGDNNPSTQYDTVHINAGQSVLFTWESGIHTTTNGDASLPDNGGDLWNAPIDTNHKSYTVTLTTPGTYPFFCAVHGSQMTGTIIVDAATPTAKTSWGGLKAKYR
jgi:plastocyanin